MLIMAQGSVLQPLDSQFYKRGRNTQEAIKMLNRFWQLVKGKFNFKILKFVRPINGCFRKPEDDPNPSLQTTGP